MPNKSLWLESEGAEQAPEVDGDDETGRLQCQDVRHVKPIITYNVAYKPQFKFSVR